MKRMLNVRQLCLLFIATFALSFFVTQPALAQVGGEMGSFRCEDGRSTGALFVETSSCPKTISSKNIFSFLVCNMEELSSALLGNVYCGMMDEMLPAIQAMLVLAVIFFGISFTIGLIPIAAREFQSFLIKIALIYALATQADLLIGFGYRFFIMGIRDGVAIALSALNTDTASRVVTSGQQVYQQLDSFLGTAIQYAVENVGAKHDGTENFCKNAVYAVIVIMMVAFPPAAYISILLIIKIALTFLRAVFGYIYALTGIAFLFTLAPFFLSFYLFRVTRSFFDKWVGYMASYSLQIVILFAVLAFVLSINVSNVTTSLTDVIITADKDAKETTNFRFPWEYCTLCEFKVVNKTTGEPVEMDSKEFLSEGKLQCEMKDGKPKPYTITTSQSPPSAAEKKAGVTNEQLKTLFKFTTTALLSLLVLAFIVDALLRYASSIAQQIAAAATGTTYATQLGGGLNLRGSPTVDVPFMSRGGFGESAAKSFTDTFAASREGNKDSVSRGAEGFKKSWQGLFEGKVDQEGKPVGSDAQRSFVNWLTDPNRLD